MEPPIGSTDWLLDSDPAIRWQVLRDLTGASAEEVAAERARVARQGWGAALLARQAPGGQWGAADDDGWMTTVDALALLVKFGVDPTDPQVRRAIGLVVDKITWWQLDGRPFFDGETEACINGRILGAGAYFGEPTDRLAQRLLDEQLDDGGWNCEAPPSRRSSFHSTICVLEGLLAYEATQEAPETVRAARLRGEAYLLERRMLRSLTTGEVINPRWTEFGFPSVWHYDLLRGLDYLRAAGVAADARVAEALQHVRQRQLPDGSWPMDCLHLDRLSFALEPRIGEASRWNTLRARRVLDWAGQKG